MKVAPQSADFFTLSGQRFDSMTVFRMAFDAIQSQPLRLLTHKEPATYQFIAECRGTRMYYMGGTASLGACLWGTSSTSITAASRSGGSHRSRNRCLPSLVQRPPPLPPPLPQGPRPRPRPRPTHRKGWRCNLAWRAWFHDLLADCQAVPVNAGHPPQSGGSLRGEPPPSQ